MRPKRSCGMSRYTFGTYDAYVGNGGKFDIKSKKDLRAVTKKAQKRSDDPICVCKRKAVFMSAFTKKAIIASFTKLLKDRPFDKITITDITEDCGIARMTFYYHFQDIYDLVDYVIEEKLLASVNKSFTYETWQQDYTAVFEAALKEKSFFAKIFSSIDLRRIEFYLSDIAREYIYKIIDEQAQRMRLSPSAENRQMLCDIYCYCVVGLLLNWISTGMKEEPHGYVTRFYNIMRGTLKASLENARENA